MEYIIYKKDFNDSQWHELLRRQAQFPISFSNMKNKSGDISVEFLAKFNVDKYYLQTKHIVITRRETLILFLDKVYIGKNVAKDILQALEAHTEDFIYFCYEDFNMFRLEFFDQDALRGVPSDFYTFHLGN